MTDHRNVVKFHWKKIGFQTTYRDGETHTIMGEEVKPNRRIGGDRRGPSRHLIGYVTRKALQCLGLARQRGRSAWSIRLRYEPSSNHRSPIYLDEPNDG